MKSKNSTKPLQRLFAAIAAYESGLSQPNPYRAARRRARMAESLAAGNGADPLPVVAPVCPKCGNIRPQVSYRLGVGKAHCPKCRTDFTV